MQRITISVSDGLSAALEDVRHDRGQATRSEAVRDLGRDGIERWREENVEAAFCVANLSYACDRRIRALAQRLAGTQHAHHDPVMAATTVRLDHFHAMESVMLRGTTAAMRAFADRVRAGRGVRSGSINLLRVETHDDHASGGDHDHAGRARLSPLN